MKDVRGPMGNCFNQVLALWKSCFYPESWLTLNVLHSCCLHCYKVKAMREVICISKSLLNSHILLCPIVSCPSCHTWLAEGLFVLLG